MASNRSDSTGAGVAVATESVNKSGTYAWMMYQLYDMWMTTARNSFYLSTDLAPLAPLDDAPRNYDEAKEVLDKHIEDTMDIRRELSRKYARGIQILTAIFRSSEVPLLERGDLPLSRDSGAGDVVTVAEMDAEMADIISRYDKGEDVGVIDIALKNAYAMYRGKRPWNTETLKLEAYLAQQVQVSVNMALTVMRNIYDVIPSLYADYVAEMTAKNDDRFSRVSPDKAREIFFEDVGGLIYPSIDSREHHRLMGEARKANARGMGGDADDFVIDRYLGTTETPMFSQLTPFLFSAPGAGKNALAEKMAKVAGTSYKPLMLPVTRDTDFVMSSFDPKTGTVSSSLTENAYKYGTDPGIFLGDEAARRNVEGTTGVEYWQEFLYHRILNSKNPGYKLHPLTLIMLASNTNKNEIMSQTGALGKANRDRVVPFEITDEMTATGLPRYLQQTYGKRIVPGTPLYLFYEFLASDDPNLGCRNLLNKANVRETSLDATLRSYTPSGRPLTEVLDDLMAQGDRKTSMGSVMNSLRRVAGPAFEARFKAFAKVAGSIPTAEKMLEAADEVPYVVAVSAFDVNFGTLDRESGKFKLTKGDIPPETIFSLNGGKGLSKETVEKLSKAKSNFIINSQRESVEKMKYIDTAKAALGRIDARCAAAKGPEDKKFWKDIQDNAKKTYAYLEKLDSATLAEDMEGFVNKIFTIDRPEDGEKVPVGLDSVMVQKLMADRIVTAFESYIDSCYIGRGREPKPMDEQKLRQFMTVIFACPFPNHRENMLAQVENILTKTYSESTEKGIMKCGFKTVAGDTVSGESLIKTVPFLKDMAFKEMVLNVFFRKLPVVSLAEHHSRRFQNFLDKRLDFEPDDGLAM